MTNLRLDDLTESDPFLQRARDLLAASQRVQRTDGISWLQRHLKIGHQQAIRLTDALVASGEMIRVPQAAGYSYLKAGDGEVHKVCKVMVFSDLTTTTSAVLTKWRRFLSNLGEVELEVTPLPARSAVALSAALRGWEWDYLIFDVPRQESAPL